MNREAMINNWLRFLFIAIGLPIIFYFVGLFLSENLLVYAEQEISAEPATVLFYLTLFWLFLMWGTFPESASDYEERQNEERQDEERQDEITEVSLHFIAFASGISERLYSDVPLKELPQEGVEIALSGPDGVSSEIILGTIKKVVQLSHKTDEGSTYVAMIQIDPNAIEKLKHLGWESFT